MSTPAFEPLRERWIASAFRLSAQSGWNQTEQDWRRLLWVNPGRVKVWIDQAEVRAAFSVTAYGNKMAWIGMLLVDEAYRGQGLGKITFQTCLAEAKALDVETIGLDATDMGEPIYRKAGFQAVHPVTRWGGTLRADQPVGAGSSIRSGLNDSILELDFRIAGVDRSRLLRDLADSDAFCHILAEGGVACGYVFARPGRTAFHLGPLVAETREQMRDLLRAALANLKGASVICDALSAGSETVLDTLGLKPLRHLQRMARPGLGECFRHESLRLGAGFEWG